MNADSKPTAQEFLDMPLDKAFPIIESFTKEESKEMISQIRFLGKKNNPDLDKLYFVLSHLEEIQAVQKEQSRLNSLLWVYVLGFGIFSGFLAYLLISQRKTIREIQRNLT
jgi:hypothetical protein